ncbi:MAG: hypothetical protein GF364_06040 [Candidatus Lokiarchaeota archaeon]|nr:hypothetical protein [Candidatus Lokiarchaeota archaeon]
MRLIKLQVSNKFLRLMGLRDLLKNFKRLEVLNAYQYDRKNFFSIQKITFYEEQLEDIGEQGIENYLKDKFNATDVDIIENISKTTFVCMMQQKRFRGFWTLIIPKGPWALAPPGIINNEFAIFSIITTEEWYQKKLRRALIPYGRFFRVLAISKVEDYRKLMHVHAFPEFTKRQQEIASFAVRNGLYETPKQIKAEDIAEKFNISVSTLNEHLRKVEKKAMHYFFGH